MAKNAAKQAHQNQAISTSNHMFRNAIWDKLPKCIFDNFEIARVKQGQFQNIQKSQELPKNHPNQTCDHWSITPNQPTLCIETNIF